MKGSRFCEEQIVGVLKEAEAGVPMKDLCRRIGISGLQHGAATQFVGVPDARRICRGQRLWKRRWLRHLGKRYAFPTFPQPRRRRPYFNRRSGTQNPGSFVMTGPKTGSRSHDRDIWYRRIMMPEAPGAERSQWHN
jgi:hypothetical protein